VAFEQKNDTGALFKNKKKESDRHPDYTGTATVNGQKLSISAWINESNAGEKYMSLKFEEPRSPRQPAGEDYHSVKAREQAPDDSDVPF